MKLFLLLILCCLLNEQLVMGQDLTIEQTLSYINEKLNDKNNKFSVVGYGYKKFGQIMKEYSCSVTIKDGRLILSRRFVRTYTPEYYENTKPKDYVYVFDELSIPVLEIDKDYNYSSGKMNRCYSTPAELYIPQKNISHRSVRKITKRFDHQGIELDQKTELGQFFILEFSNDNLICDKLRNAFTHLINLTSKDSAYYTLIEIPDNDPFANSAKKDTLKLPSLTVINSNSIPMTKIGGVYEIPIIINNVIKLNFVFDPGAADVSISADVALTLIRTGTVTEKDFLGTETYKFADGTTAKSKVFIIKEIRLGNKTVTNVKAAISNSIKAPLLLGQSLLNKFGKVIIDYNKGVITFQE
jgi:aspartyl protease family protein